MTKNERSFIYLLGEEFVEATEYQNINEHWDVEFLDIPEWGKIDIKGLKKKNRSDKDTLGSIHWIELENVLGNPGRLYGKADSFAFELDNQWIIVLSKDLREYINSVCVDDKIYSTKQMYKKYQRSKFGRKDVVVMVPSKDLLDITFYTIYKNNNNE